ncbi:MAG: hypothetical protein MSH65_07515 [Spirochaetia bacterium]|nr:hypothetical protein [Spirochaetia bacterium]
MEEDFELTNYVVNGYWYTFQYLSKKEKEGYDRDCFIYCIGPFEKNINCFWGINLHHLTLSNRIRLFEKMLSDQQFIRDEKRYFFNKETLMSYLHEQDPKMAGIRVYDRRNARQIYRVKNEAVAKYLFEDGQLYMSNPSQKAIEYALNSRKSLR